MIILDPNVLVIFSLIILSIIFICNRLIHAKERTYEEEYLKQRRILDSKARDLEQKSDELRKKEQALSYELEQRELALSKEKEKLQYRESLLQSKELDCDERLKQIRHEEFRINEKVRQQIFKTVVDISGRDYLVQSPVFSSLHRQPDYDRLSSSLTQDIHLSAPFDISSRIIGNNGSIYDVTLYSCTCKDFTFRKKPCKHMYRLAVEVGALLSFDCSDLEQKVADLQRKQAEATLTINQAKSEKSKIAKERNALNKILSETSQQYPWLSNLYSDCLYALDGELEKNMRDKLSPAKSSADKLKIIRKERRLLQAQCKSLEYQLHFYETLFPWLEEFKTIPPMEAYQAQQDTLNENPSVSEYETLRNWLSPEEYRRLSTSEKYQLALDRYQTRSKTNWDIGVEYERYIGYLCEQDGYRVHYTGANLGLEDMGRDLILTKGTDCIIVQCKRWSQEKTIHEKHIFQLFGSCVLYDLQNPGSNVRGVFVTTTHLSPVAQKCADYLGILTYESVPFAPYPMIKCNISRSGEKIYHLPFDQQYDRAVIDSQTGEFFAFTVSEAESAGFRRAKAHIPTPAS